MTENRKPVARLSIRRDGTTFNILSIWPGKFPGTYDISREKPSDRRQVMSFGDALRAWSSGDGYLSISVEAQREPYQGNAPAPRNSAPAPDDFGADDMPF
jgi:hypothetical protein